MQSAGVTPVFWKDFSSRVERAVMGAIAQDGMEQAKQRMMQGNLDKARSGRVTARTPAYGYKFVDRYGNEGYAAKQDTYYAIREDEAAVVRRIFEAIANGQSLRGLGVVLTQEGVPPPKQAIWVSAQLRIIIKNEVYRGDFYAHRWEHTTVEKPSKDGLGVRTVKCKVERPPEHWIHVPVPPIVSRELWDAANAMLVKNQQMARRNAKEPYLLTGLITCAVCGYNYVGTTRGNPKQPRHKRYRGYRCPVSGSFPRHVREFVGCNSGQIPCSVIEPAVWKLVCTALLQPETLVRAIESDAYTERNQRLQEQIAYLEREIATRHDGDEKLYRAYMAGAFDEQEYAARRRMLKTESATMSEQLEALRTQVVTVEEVEARKAQVHALAEQAAALNLLDDIGFADKQRIIKLLVDSITLHVGEGWFRLEGVIRGVFSIENTLVGTGYGP
jgi:site-specific DNA recombinase